MSATDAIEGKCLCGAVTIRIDGPHDPRPGVCHCRMCQRWSGGAFMAFNASAKAVTISGEVRLFQSSTFAERAFCPVCGSHLYSRDLDSDTYELMPGLFDAARDWPLRSEIYTDQALASVQLRGAHNRATAAEYEAKNKFVEGETP